MNPFQNHVLPLLYLVSQRRLLLGQYLVLKILVQRSSSLLRHLQQVLAKRARLLLLVFLIPKPPSEISFQNSAHLMVWTSPYHSMSSHQQALSILSIESEALVRRWRTDMLKSGMAEAMDLIRVFLPVWDNKGICYELIPLLILFVRDSKLIL